MGLHCEAGVFLYLLFQDLLLLQICGWAREGRVTSGEICPTPEARTAKLAHTPAQGLRKL